MNVKKKFEEEVESNKTVDYSIDITNFISKILRPPFGSLRRKDIIEMIPTFLEYTKRDNYNWVAHPKFEQDLEFQTVLAESIKNIKVYKKGLCYTELLSKVSPDIRLRKEYLTYLLEQHLTDRDIKFIFQSLCFQNSEDTRYFLERIKTSNPTLWSDLVQICEITRNEKVLNENVDLFLERTENYKRLTDCPLLTKENKEKVNKYIDEHIDDILGKERIRNWYLLYLTCGEDNKHKVINYVAEHIDLLLKEYRDKFQFMNELNSKTDLIEKDKIIEAYEKYIEENLNPAIAGITLYADDKYLSEEMKINGYLSNEVLVEMISIIVKEICRNEGVGLKDIRYLSGGYYSKAYQIGDKIIKFGHSREKFEFPNNPYVIAPLLRRKFEIENSTANELFIEIQERVEIVDMFHVSEEELYQLYKNIRDLGLIWFDVDARNVGRLIKDNVIHWDGEIAQIDEALSFEPKRGTVTLKAGELVVLDADFIFNEVDAPEKYFEGNWGYIQLQKAFEERYQKEKIGKYQGNTEGKKNGL